MRMTDTNLTKRILNNADQCGNYTRSLMFWGTLRGLLKFNDRNINDNQLIIKAYNEDCQRVLLGLSVKYPELVYYTCTHDLNTGIIKNVYKLIKAMEKDFPVNDSTPNYY